MLARGEIFGLARFPIWEAAILAVVLLVSTIAFAQGDPDLGARAVRQPQRWTAGATNQLMGVLDPDEQALYFVSDKKATLGLFVQSPIQTGPRPLFADQGDAAWPQPSPDGRNIAYISYVHDATGDICIRAVKGDSDGRCLTGLGSSELQVLWSKDSDHLFVLSRHKLHGDFELRKLSMSRSTNTVVLRRNMVGLALSPDNHWLAYIPIDRQHKGVGISFAKRTGVGIHLHAMDRKGKPIVYQPPLPGVTGYLAFSRDGRWLYFAQYLNDTNRDGVINGNDHSVLFRVAFRSKAGHPIGPEQPNQLTSAGWDCHYPAPSRTKLVMTCTHQGSLDVYTLPLEGAVPSQWTRERLAGEKRVARNLWVRLLLLARALALETEARQRGTILRQMVMAHLSLREYESAVYYCDQIVREMGEQSPEATWARLMATLAKHRRQDIALTRGQLTNRYLASEKKRAKHVATLAAKASLSIAALSRLIVSEIQDDLGDKQAAYTIFSSVPLATIKDPLVLEIAAERARRIFALQADRQGHLAQLAILSQHTALEERQRLVYAHDFVETLLRGVPLKQRMQRIAAWKKRVSDDSELALLLQVETVLAGLTDANQEDIRKQLFSLYRQQKDTDWRQAVVFAIIQFATRKGNEYLLYQFATSWVSWLRRAHPERKYAEQLYRRIVLDRGYGELGQEHISEARGYFFMATKQTLSLEAHSGFVEALLKEGTKDPSKVYADLYRKDPNHPSHRFVRAYLLARKLPSLVGDAERHRQIVGSSRKLLEEVASVWPMRREVHHLWGYVLHQQAVLTGDVPAAAGANRHYLLALDLAQGNERAEASLLQSLGLLQAALGNHRLAIEYYQRRALLPHVRPKAQLSFHLYYARSLFFVDNNQAAYDQVVRGLAVLEEHPPLHRFRALVIDRLALYQASAGAYDKAEQSYRKLLSLLSNQSNTNGTTRMNRGKAHLGLAMAMLRQENPEGAARQLSHAQAAMNGRQPPPVTQGSLWTKSLLPGQSWLRRDFHILISGLQAQAYRALGQRTLAKKALLRRKRGITQRWGEAKADEDLLELARTNFHLGELAYRAGKHGVARAAFMEGLAQSARYNRSTGSEVNPVGLQLLRAYTELHLYGGKTLGRDRRTLQAELAKVYAFICKHPSPRWESYRFLFAYYLTILNLEKRPV